MSPDQAILDVEALVQQVVKDIVALKAGPVTSVAILSDVVSLVAPLSKVIPELSQLGPELKALDLTSAIALLGSMVSQLALSGKSLAIASAVINLVKVSEPVPSAVEAVIAAIKS